MKTDFTIVQVNDYDIAGGAEVISMNLFVKYLDRGYRSSLLVGMKRGSDPRLQEINMGTSSNPWEGVWLTKAGRFRHGKDKSKIQKALYYFSKFLAHPINTICLRSGIRIRDFDFPATQSLLHYTPDKPDILHLHNLHGDYFDLRALPYLSHEVPVILTLHDKCLMENCWRTDFQQLTPDTRNQLKKVMNVKSKLTEYFSSKDTIKNAHILKRCTLYLSTPSAWLMDQALNSIIAPAIKSSKVIHNGVDLTIFHPYDRGSARAELGLSANAKILSFVANNIRNNPSKDYKTLVSAVSIVATTMKDQNIILLAIGEAAPTEKIGNAEVHFVPFQQNLKLIARYYQASDIYVHAAKIDTFPTTVLEAFACGKPVVATAVGGIPEQIQPGFNGFLTRPGDPEDMAEKIEILLKDDILREEMGKNAYNDAKTRFDLNLQADRYLEWYSEILSSRKMD